MPVELKLRRAEQQLMVRWQDGKDSVYDAGTLRRNCPCATCRTERDRKAAAPPTMLQVLPGGGDVRITGAELVGQYAVKLLWSDGHDTGIYDYRYLRSLDAT